MMAVTVNDKQNVTQPFFMPVLITTMIFFSPFYPTPHPNLNISLLPSSFPAKSCDEFTDLNLSHAIAGTNIRIRLLLYTRDKGTCGTLMSHTNLSTYPQFNVSRPTTFVIHGYRPSGSPPVWLHNITELLLARKDMNLIIVDWNRGAANVNYFKAVENTHKAADNLTAFIEKMRVCFQHSF